MKIHHTFVLHFHKLPVIALFSLLTGLSTDQLPAQSSPKDSHQLLPPVTQLETSRRLSLKEFRAYVESKGGLILDARPESYFQKGHVPGALSLPLENFDKQYAQLRPKLESDKSRKIVVYCSSFSCEASGLVQKKLISLGFTQVYLFPNGWATWQKASLPEEKSS